jgi:hypothetical protein
MAYLRKPGKRLFQLDLFGKKYDVRLAPDGHEVFEAGENERVWGITVLEDRTMYLNASGTPEQRHTTLLHEVQHLIEEHYCLDHMDRCTTEAESEARTDKISLGWLYFMRSNRHAVDYIRGGA